LNVSGNPIINVDGLLSATEYKKLKYLYTDLDVGNDFEKVKEKIQTKFDMAMVGNYRDYMVNNPAQVE
jgi:hypothetical protein